MLHGILQQDWPDQGRNPLQPASQPKEVREMPQGYCVKDREKVEIQNPQQVTMKNGRPAIQGTCPKCGTKIFKIGKLEG
jgi:hypothetical protein